MHRRVLLSGLLALAACGPRRVAPPPATPRLTGAVDLISPDLDVVARLDMARMKAALGGLTAELLSRDVLARTAGERGDEPDELVVESLLQADVVYLGYRPSPQLLPLDRVLALEGHFEPLGRPRGFSAPTDLGGDLRYWERRREAGPLPRSGVARIYAAGDRVRAFVSEAELDAVERALGGSSAARRLSPPEEGSLSLSLRPRLLGQYVHGTLRELLEDAQALALVIELESDAGKVTLTLVAAEPAHAERLAAASKDALRRVLGERADTVRLDVVGERLTLSLKASRAELGGLLACARAGSPSAPGCAW